MFSVSVFFFVVVVVSMHILYLEGGLSGWEWGRGGKGGWGWGGKLFIMIFRLRRCPKGYLFQLRIDYSTLLSFCQLVI